MGTLECSQRNVAAMLLMPLVLLAAGARAASIPGIPEPFPSGGLSGLRQGGSIFLVASDPTFQNPSSSVQRNVPAAERVLFTSTYTDMLEATVGDWSTISGTTQAEAAASGTAAFGVLRGGAGVSLVGGPAEARAQVIVEFWDFNQFQSRDPNQRTSNFSIDWKTDGIIDGFGSAIAELWIIESLGQTSSPSGFTNQGVYIRHTWDSSGKTRLQIGDSSDFVLGNRYWLYGRLTVSASRNHNFFADGSITSSSHANFLSTAQVFIDAAPDRPDLFMTSVSGYDYRTPAPVPAPSTLVLALTGLPVIGLMRGRRKIPVRCVADN